MTLGLTDILSISLITGLGTSSAVIIGLLTKDYYYPLDWKDIALTGCVGSFLGARYSFKIMNRFN